METCKDCIYFPKCDEYPFDESGCKDFKDRSRFVELPCKVGDMVHRKDGAWNVVGFECDRSSSWKVKLERWKDQFWDYHETTKIVFKSLGETAFLSDEEAKKAFAERSVGK